MLLFVIITTIALAIACVLMIALLIALRLGFELHERRAARRNDALRGHLLEMLMGEPLSAMKAERRLVRMQGREFEAVRTLALEMLPKLRGESRERLIDLLRTKGGIADAVRLTRSSSSVRRCRGAFALGMLADRSHESRVLELLDDPNFLVRRVATRALGNMESEAAVGDLLRLSREEPRLSRDVAYALHRIGPAAAPRMREELRICIRDDEWTRSGELAATVLGLLGDYQSREVLEAGLQAKRPAFAAACADALGAICDPQAEGALHAALSQPAPEVRAAAARALGSMGSEASVPGLLALTDQENPIASRDAANAMLNLGTSGVQALQASRSSYAREALALAAVRGRRA